MILGLDNQTKFVEMSGGRCLKDIIIFDGAFGTYYTGLYGICEYLGIDPTVVRIICVLLSIGTIGLALLVLSLIHI